MDKGVTEEGQTMIYKTLHIKIKIEQYEPHKNRMETRAPEEQAVPAPLVTPVEMCLTLIETPNVILYRSSFKM